MSSNPTANRLSPGLDAKWEKRRQRDTRIRYLMRGLILFGVLSFAATMLITQFQLQEAIVDQRGAGDQTIRSFNAAVDIPVGSTVSFDEDNNVRPGLGVTTHPNLGTTFSSSCPAAEAQKGHCLWQPVRGSHSVNTTLAQFTFSSATHAVTAHVLSISDNSVANRHVAVALPPLPSSTVSSTTELVSVDAFSTTAQLSGIRLGMIVFVQVNNGTDTTSRYFRVSGTLAALSVGTLFDVDSTNIDSHVPRALIHFVGSSILVGANCGTNDDLRCCMHLLAESQPLTSLANVELLSTCAKSAQAIGDYVATAVNPLQLLRIHHQGASQRIELVQQEIQFPWFTGDIGALVALPSTHPEAKFVAVVASEYIVRTFYLEPSVHPPPANGSSVLFEWYQGPTIATPSPVSVRAAVFMPPTADVLVAVAGPSLQYVFRVAMLKPLASALAFVEAAFPTESTVLLYDSFTSTVLLGGPAVAAGRSQLVSISWYGGYRLAGIAQADARAGNPVPIVRSGVSALHQGLTPAQQYMSGPWGELIPYHGVHLVGPVSKSVAGGIPTTGHASQWVVVGTAITETELEVYLH